MTKETLTRFPGVYRRTDSLAYQFGPRVPKDLTHRFATAWAVRCSLETSDLRVANAKAVQLQARWAGEFARLREATLAPSTNLVTATSKPQDLNALRRHLLSRLESALDALDTRIAGCTADQRREAASSWRWQRDDAREGLEFSNCADDLVAFIQSMVRGTQFVRSAVVDAEILAHYVSYADVIAEAYEDHSRIFPVRAQVLGAKRALTASGWAVPSLSVRTNVATNQKTLMDALAAWERSRPRPQKTVSAFTRHAQHFTDVMGLIPLHTIDKAVARRFRDSLIEWARNGAKTANTANNILVSVRSLANVARDQGWMDVDAFERLTVEVGGKESLGREPWTHAELIKLFDDPIWNSHSLPSAPKSGGAAAYWIPLIACYTGARVSEIASLWTDDLDTSVGGEVIEFRADASRGKRLKNDGSWRAVPMHNELIRLGLPDYAKTLPIGPLFPDVKTNGKNGAGGMFGQWFGEFKKSKGFNTSDKSMHSFRHLVATELRLKNVNEAIANAIVGHVGEGIGQKIYAATIRRQADGLRKAVNLLEFPISNLAAFNYGKPLDASLLQSNTSQPN